MFKKHRAPIEARQAGPSGQNAAAGPLCPAGADPAGADPQGSIASLSGFLMTHSIRSVVSSSVLPPLRLAGRDGEGRRVAA